MKRFIIWISVVIVTVLAVDCLSGFLFRKYTTETTLPGDYEAVDMVLRRSHSDVLVLGSSVALNSINTKTIEDSTGLQTYNGGGNGQTFPFFLTMLKAAVTEHVPQKVILCIQPNALSEEGLGPRYNLLTPYYGLNIADIDSNLNKVRPHNDVLLKLTAYKLNTIWFRILLYHFMSGGIVGENGHISKPLPPSFPVKQTLEIGQISVERKGQLDEFIEICEKNNIELYIIFTPLYNTLHSINEHRDVVSQTKELGRLKGIKVYDDMNLDPFASDSTLFYDNSHININGTKIYTDTIIHRLRSY